MIKQFQYKGYGVILWKAGKYFQVDIYHDGSLDYVYEFLTATEAEELYNSQRDIMLV